MPEKDERVAATFWLKDKQVNGVVIGEHGGEKLVLYASRYYIVKDKTPAKRHYTDSTLPSLWKKVKAGETPPPPKAPKRPKSPRAGKPEKSPKPEKAPEPPRATKGKKAVAAAPETLGKKSQAAPAAPTPPAKAARQRRKRGEVAEVPNAGQQGSQKTVDEAQKVKYHCPYCRTNHTRFVAPGEIPSPYFEKCSSCGKTFGVKLITKVVSVETAAFQQGK